MIHSGRCKTCDAPLYSGEASCRYCGASVTDMHDHNDMRSVGALVVAGLLVMALLSFLVFA